MTGRHWTAYSGVYYDCHTVSLGQVLPQELFHAFMIVTSACRLDLEWGGLSCRTLLDSEVARDVVLLEQWGVRKHRRPSQGDLEQCIQDTVRQVGYCICRVDSFYHRHFEEFFFKQHRTNGHKITVIDWDDQNYYGIDNVGADTRVLDFERGLFLESVRSNLFHVYEKEDTLYYLELGARYRENAVAGEVSRRVEQSIRDYLAGRERLPDILPAYLDAFSRDVTGGDSTRAYAQLHNSYTTAYLIETSYQALQEAFRFDPGPWRAALPRADEFMAAHEATLKGWRMFKMLCKAYETSKRPELRQLVAALGRVVEFEKTTEERRRP